MISQDACDDIHCLHVEKHFSEQWRWCSLWTKEKPTFNTDLRSYRITLTSLTCHTLPDPQFPIVSTFSHNSAPCGLFQTIFGQDCSCKRPGPTRTLNHLTNVWSIKQIRKVEEKPGFTPWCVFLTARSFQQVLHTVAIWSGECELANNRSQIVSPRPGNVGKWKNILWATAFEHNCLKLR